jgi:hypothetical protein
MADNQFRGLDWRWFAASIIFGLGVAAFAAAVVVREHFDPNGDRLEPAFTISIVLALTGMALPLLSAIPLWHLRWWLIPYVAAGYVGGFMACVVLVVIASIVWPVP